MFCGQQDGLRIEMTMAEFMAKLCLVNLMS
uniref:Transposase n=1 Tax=Ralstonia solanacearum CFBP2957 TaxID=859656 RepID=D8P268_RALSL|nr:protein of unknown function [Ralstonia solanacearum CFBP2957]